MRKTSDPPTRKTYLGMIIATPLIVLLALKMQDDLTSQTAVLTLSVTALLYWNLRWIQDFFRSGWRQDYEIKLSHTEAELARVDLSVKERRRLQRYLTMLPDRYHLVTSPDQTYRQVKVVGATLRAVASLIKNFWR